MEIYLLRHGIAVDRDAHQLRSDAHRPLTEEGFKRTRKVTKALAALGVSFAAVLTSPLVRAKQTADLAVEALGIPAKLRLCDALAPGGKARDLIAEIKRLVQPDEAVLLVGHEPDMSRFASLLISGEPDADLTLKKAGLCVLDAGDLVPDACATLELLLTPKLLIRLGK